MHNIPVYKSERDAGLEHAVRTSAVQMASIVQLATPATPARGRPGVARASVDDVDLHHLTTVLATTGWNKNDDCFDPLETWAARKTPTHKPLNYEHKGGEIVGHMTEAWVTDTDGNTLADDTAEAALPEKFHVVTAGVLYRVWQDQTLQARADKLVDEIAKGEWFVSMECLFRDFDYSLKASNGSTKVVTRNDQTAFLTKHLRAYGGTGQYGTSSVGRVMRRVVFTGKALVRNPANPESLILSSSLTATASRGFAAAGQKVLVRGASVEADIAEWFRR